MSINAINFQKTTNTHFATKTNTSVQQPQKEKDKQIIQQQKNICADDIFAYLNATNTTIIHKNQNTNSVKNDIGADRISKSIKEFENMFNKNLDSVKSEFTNIPDNLAQKIALSMF